MKTALVLILTNLAILFSNPVAAQDLLASTGQIERSYNYVEGFYLLNLEKDLPDEAEVDLPLLVRLSLDLSNMFSLRGEFVNQSYKLTVASGETVATLERTVNGGALHAVFEP